MTIEYNTCDVCNESINTLELYWTEYDLEDKKVSEQIFSHDAVCENCLKKYLEESE